MGRKSKRNIIRPKKPTKITKEGKLVYPTHDEEIYWRTRLQEEYYLKAEKEYDDRRLFNEYINEL